jgi:acetyl-CoA carboxylase biotin carboxyl carrier protein
MQPADLPPRTATGGSSAPDDPGRSLRDEVVDLARALPGDLRRLTVRSGDRAIEIEWTRSAAAGGEQTRRTAPLAAAPAPEPDAPDLTEGLAAVRAPLVGTFYSAPTPDADPFVREGEEVEAGQTLGIVEAMKLMNPILADEPGVVAEIRVENAESVEYDQVLMLLRPSGRPA